MDEASLDDALRAGSEGGARNATSSSNISSTTERRDLSTISVLVVDDEADLRDAVIFDFKRKGFTVYSAANGTEALGLIETKNVQLVISDIRMPNGDGLFLLEKIQRLAKKIPLIFITGFSDVPEADCLARGAFAVIKKPFDRKVLMQTALDALFVVAKA